MVWCLRADVHIAVDYFHITPQAVFGLSGQTAQVLHSARLFDLDKGSAICLTNGAELSSVRRCPPYES